MLVLTGIQRYVLYSWYYHHLSTYVIHLKIIHIMFHPPPKKIIIYTDDLDLALYCISYFFRWSVLLFSLLLLTMFFCLPPNKNWSTTSSILNVHFLVVIDTILLFPLLFYLCCKTVFWRIWSFFVSPSNDCAVSSINYHQRPLLLDESYVLTDTPSGDDDNATANDDDDDDNNNDEVV